MKRMIVLMILAMGLSVTSFAQQTSDRVGGRGNRNASVQGRRFGMLVFQMTPEQVLEKFDINKDGSLSVEEIVAWKNDHKLKVYDINRDGKISDEEINRIDTMKKRMKEMRSRKIEKTETDQGKNQFRRQRKSKAE